MNRLGNTKHGSECPEGTFHWHPEGISCGNNGTVSGRAQEQSSPWEVAPPNLQAGAPGRTVSLSRRVLAGFHEGHSEEARRRTLLCFAQQGIKVQGASLCAPHEESEQQKTLLIGGSLRECGGDAPPGTLQRAHQRHCSVAQADPPSWTLNWPSSDAHRLGTPSLDPSGS